MCFQACRACLPSLSLSTLDRSVITTYAPAKPVSFGQYTSGLAWTLGRSSRCRSYRQEATPISPSYAKETPYAAGALRDTPSGVLAFQKLAALGRTSMLVPSLRNLLRR